MSHNQSRFSLRRLKESQGLYRCSIIWLTCSALLAFLSAPKLEADVLTLDGTGTNGSEGIVHVTSYIPATNSWNWNASITTAVATDPVTHVPYNLAGGIGGSFSLAGDPYHPTLTAYGSGTIPAGAAFTFQVGDIVNFQGADFGTLYSGVIPLTPPVYPLYVSGSQRRMDQTTTGEPVQLGSGSESRHQTLFTFTGARNWRFELTYNSMLARNITAYQTPMPLGWSHNFQATVVPIPLTPDVSVNWTEQSSCVFAPSSNPNILTSADDGARFDTITLQTGGGWLLTHRDQSSLLFDAYGRLIEDRDSHGRKLVLAYTSGVLTSITDPVSSTGLTLAYSSGMLSTLTDGTGAAVVLGGGTVGSFPSLSQITNQDGKVTSFRYSTTWQLTTILDDLEFGLLGNTNDNLGRVVTQSDARGHVSSFAYSNQTILNAASTTTYTDRNGQIWVYSFDIDYNLLSVTNPLSKTTSYTYDLANNLTSVTDPLSRATSYTYDTHGNVLTTVDAASNVTTFTYDSANNLLTTKDPANSVATSTYDANNNLLTYIDALGHTTTWTYDSNSLPLTKTLPRGGVFTYAYTAGELTHVTDPNGIVTAFVRDADGRVLSVADALGNLTVYTYDAAGNRLTSTNPLSQVYTYLYDYRNRLTSVTDPATAVTAYAYDGNGNVITLTDAIGYPTASTYDSEDRLLTKTDAASEITTNVYDNAGHLLNITDSAHNVTTFGYDAAGQLTSMTDALGKITAYAYDARSLLTGVTDPLIRVATFTNDSLGRRTASVDPLTRQTNLGYDVLSRLTSATDPGSLVTAQAYDNDGDRSSITNPAGKATAFTYDLGDRIASNTTPAGHATTYSYDSRGLPLTVTQPSAHATTLAYDTAERLSLLVDPVGTIALTRDADGRILTTVEGTQTLTRVYNKMGRLTSFTDGFGNLIKYYYDALNRLVQLQYPNGSSVFYSYDAAGNLGGLSDFTGGTWTYSYDADRRMTQVLRPNGTKQVRTYDSAGQLTLLTDYAPNGTTVIYSASYGYDVAGQMTTASLVPATTGVTPNVTQTFDQDDRLLTQNGSAVSFDADGNLLSIASGVAPATYTYDARNRLTSAGGLTYGYDSENRRVSVADSTGTTKFAINPNAALDQVLVKTSPTGTSTYYVYGLGLLSESSGGVVRYYHGDQRGDTVALTDSTGAVTGTAAYGAYGEILTQTGNTSTPFLFNGAWGVQTDSNGLYFHRARYYHPALRRWLNADPIGLAGGVNLYGYVGNSPICFVDPLGLFMGTALDSGEWFGAVGSGALTGAQAYGKGLAIGAATGVVVVGVAAGAVAIGVPAAVVTGTLFVGGAIGGAMTAYNVVRNPSGTNIAYSIGALTGGALVGAASVSSLGGALSPEGFTQSVDSPTFSQEFDMMWRDADGNKSPFNLYADFGTAMATGPTSGGLTGGVAAWSSGVSSMLNGASAGNNDRCSK